MQILEDEHGRMPLGECLEEAPPRRERLVASVAPALLLRAHPDQAPQLCLDPARLARVGDEIRHGVDELGLGGLRGVGLEDPRLRLDDLRQSPEGHTFAVRERASLAPEDDPVGVLVDGSGELPDEAALTDPWNPHEREEL